MSELIKVYTSGGVRYVSLEELARQEFVVSTGEPPAPQRCKSCRWWESIDNIIGRCHVEPSTVNKDSTDYCSRWERGREPHE